MPDSAAFLEADQCLESVERCRFLELPTELRLMIYDHLLVSYEPLESRDARNDKRYNLSFAILRVNQFVYHEASVLFYQNNIFNISRPANSNAGNFSANDSNQINPPLPRHHWPFLRNISIDLMYTPETSQPESKDAHWSWSRDDPGCVSYIRSLTSLLQLSGPQLRRLKLTANATGSAFARKSLGSFFICDRDRAFVRTLAALKVGTVPIHFDFPDSYFHIEIDARAFLSRSILLMACQVMFCQSQARIDRLLATFGNELSASSLEAERMDLSPLVFKAWNREGH